MAIYIGSDQVEATINGETIVLNANAFGELIFELMDHECMKEAINSNRRDWYTRRTNKNVEKERKLKLEKERKLKLEQEND